MRITFTPIHFRVFLIYKFRSGKNTQKLGHIHISLFIRPPAPPPPFITECPPGARQKHGTASSYLLCLFKVHRSVGWLVVWFVIIFIIGQEVSLQWSYKSGKFANKILVHASIVPAANYGGDAEDVFLLLFNFLLINLFKGNLEAPSLPS